MKRIFAFPAELVPRGSRIILYGMGNVGSGYYYQMKTSGYCEIVALVDRTPREGIEALEYLLKLSDNDYDYIVISIVKQNLGIKLREVFMEMGIPEEKIIIPPKSTPILAEGIPDEASIETLLELDCKSDIVTLESVLNNKEKQTPDDGYFWQLYFELVSDTQKKGQRKAQITDLLMRSGDTYFRLMLHKLLYMNELYDAGLMLLFMRDVGRIENNPDLKYEYSMVVENWIFFYPHYKYPEYYTDRRRLFREVITEYSLRLNPKGYKADPNRVCIITPGITADVQNSPMNVLRWTTEELKRRGIQAIILVMTWQYNYQDNSAGDEIELPYQVIKPVGTDTKSRLQYLADAIAKYNPGVILDYSCETGALSYIYSQHFPTICVPMHGDSSSLFFHKYVSFYKKDTVAENKIYGSLSGEQITELSIFFNCPAPKKLFNRYDYNISENDFIMVTAGNRLEFELTKDFVDIICEMLKNNPKIKWILVGKDIGEYIQTVCAGLIGVNQVILWGFEHDLPGLYQMCDLYLNPDRPGGGMTMMWAMLQGIPIAMTSKVNDGHKYSREDAVDGDYNKLANYVLALAGDKLLYEQKSKKARLYAQKNNIERHVSSLMEIMRKSTLEWKL